MWPFDFSLVYTIKLSADTIETQLRVHNIGTQAFDFNTLLHTYFLIPVSPPCFIALKQVINMPINMPCSLIV